MIVSSEESGCMECNRFGRAESESGYCQRKDSGSSGNAKD